MTITNRVSLKSVMSGNTPIADVVDAPTIGAATAGIESATVAYTAAATGGTATSFTAISTPGSITGTGASPITVSGLTGGTAYTFKVYGTNASGVWSGVQSAASSSVTPTTTAFESIASATGTGSSGTITFSSIPSTYVALQIRFIGRTTSASTSQQNLFLRFNGVSSASYTRHNLQGDGSAVSAAGAASQTEITAGQVINDGEAANVMSVSIINIHNYASTTQNKTVRTFDGTDKNTSGGLVWLRSGLFIDTTAISSLSLITASGNAFTTSTQVALYGIKGA